MNLRTKLRCCLAKAGSRQTKNGAWRLKTTAYTLAHKMAFSDYEKCLTGRHTFAGRLHDCDKLFLYMLPWLDKKQIQAYHHKHQPHHLEYPQYKVSQLIQTYIDWECAAVTKPDKPLDAFATLIHCYSDKLALMLPVCLAMNPFSVSTCIADVPKEKKQDGSLELFAKYGNCANKKVYGETVRIISHIVFELKKMAKEIDAGLFSLDELMAKMPCELVIMKPVTIFLQTLAIVAKRRKQKINLTESVRVLENKLATFSKYKKFLPAEPSHCAYCTNYLFYNPFLEW